MTISGISVDSFNTFREAKRLVRQEFNHSLSLQSDDWIDTLHVFSTKSKNARLNELVKELASKN